MYYTNKCLFFGTPKDLYNIKYLYTFTEKTYSLFLPIICILKEKKHCSDISKKGIYIIYKIQKKYAISY